MSSVVYGKQPNARVGEFFQMRSHGRWENLACCLVDLAPAEAGDAKLWASDDPWECCNFNVLNSEECLKLADRLTVLLEDGSVSRYVADRNAYLEQHADVRCSVCKGSGVRVHQSVDTHDYSNSVVPEKQACCMCDGSGVTKNSRTFRDLYVSDVREFVEFLRHSGGLSKNENIHISA